MTKQLWNYHFGDLDMFWRRGAMFRGHDHPATLGISRESPIPVNHGRLHVKGTVKRPNIDRDFLKLKMSYGGEKVGRSVEVKTFNSQEDTVKLAASFEFDRAEQPDDLRVILRAYDHSFIRRKHLITLEGKCPLAQLLPPKPNKYTTELSDDSGKHRTLLSMESQVSQSRYFNIVNGKFEKHDLLPDDTKKLFRLCYAAALNKAPARTGNPIAIMRADHRLVDLVDQTMYTVRVIHSASLLLSLILVYDCKGRVLAMAHLLGPHSLPSEEQLAGQHSSQTATIPTLSTPLERAVLVSDSKGDFSVIHGVWSGFKPRIRGSGHSRGTAGNPGRLNIKVFPLRNSRALEKFSLGSRTLEFAFQSGSVSSALNGNSISMTNIWKDKGSHIASVFSVSLLFVLTNPDRIRSPSSPTAGGMACHTWPLVMALGYSQPNPSVRYLATQFSSRDTSGDATDSAGGGGLEVPSRTSPQDPAWWGLGAAVALVAAGVLHRSGAHDTTHGAEEPGRDGMDFADSGAIDGDSGGCGACAACGTDPGGGGDGGNSSGGGWFGGGGSSGNDGGDSGWFGGGESGGDNGGGGDSGGGDGGGCGGCGGCGG